jgi:light-regulated signal transduction histidine kinase (bacteriophytochrome)
MNQKIFTSILNSKGFLQDIECKAVLKDKTDVSVIINATAIKNKWGDIITTRYSLFDNTARKIAEEKTWMLNRELEAFSYSVSHDLRAPLRSINGYAQILVEDHSGKLDDEGNRVIGTIIKNSNRMGQLIDDLLDFSHANRKKIAKSQIDMNEFLQPILTELVEQEKSRDIRIDVKPLLPCFADVNMIRQVWVNLLSNALKYTRKNTTAQIELGSIRENDETIYYVKDNGVGFNMQYYDKLFGVFQRLHKMEDFDGTGVGLALVKRIIERHDGRIWAEAKLNEGAAFYFSIPGISEVQN